MQTKEISNHFKKQAATALFNTFTSNFSAEQVQKGKSKLANKINQTIAVPLITIVDDPLLKKDLGVVLLIVKVLPQHD
ncbi:hypothetical protein KHA80_02260 [Anaerobacillus sp. HL2]|nr:hypothetical protein KHA80_02260 [Anaerobacillus sp. HL2]